ncbi:MAG: YkgJ family cysteine cluster protein [Promethearchaeota archaeon]
MENKKELRFECTRCGSCCTDKNTLVNLTYLDILRIKNGLSLNLSEVLEIVGLYIYKIKITTKELNKMVISPLQTEKGPSFIGLIKDKRGFCCFYDEKNHKCLIYPLRPIFCRTFPFSFTYSSNKKKSEIELFYTEKGKQYCPGIGFSAPIINLNKWIELGKKTIKELNKNFILIKEWNKSVKEGHIIPSIKNFLLNIFKLEY